MAAHAGPSYPPRPRKIRLLGRLGGGAAQADAARGGAEGRGGVGDSGGAGGGGSAGGAAAVATRVRPYTCPFCAASHLATDEGLAALARHIASKHVSVKVEARHAKWLSGKLDVCQCGRWSRVGGQCDCGTGALRRPIHAGDTVEESRGRRPVRVSAVERTAAQAARSAAVGDYNLPDTEAWRANLDAAVLRPIAQELEKWSGSETTVHIPVRLRPELAEIMAVLLEGMVDGSEAAALMMQCLPKLLFHQNGIRKRGARFAIRQRLAMLRRNQLQQLLNTVSTERLTADRVGAKRRADGSGSNVGKVKELARDGALSKAVRRLNGLEVQRYTEAEARRWANELIPTTSDEQRGLGARPILGAEKAKLDALKTCAEKVGVMQQDEIIEVGSEDDEDGEPRGRKRVSARPKINGYAEGVRFAALSAPGPSGLRPEHLREMALSRRARSRFAFERAMGRFVAAGVKGQLPAAAWWITDSAVTFVRKPGADENAAPRPLRVGEVLRRWIAKRIVAAEREGMRKLFARRRQFGVACPGGTEILIHHRMITCGGQQDGIGDWDVDLKNCYGNLFWDAIDASVGAHIPGALPWTRWLHGRGSRVILPDGVVHMSDRGAEQGDPLGGAYAAAVIVDVCERAEQVALDVRKRAAGRVYGSELAAICILAACDKAKEGVSEQRVRAADSRGGAMLRAMRMAQADGNFGAWDRARAGETLADVDGLRLIDGWYIDDGHVRADLVDGDVWLMAFDACGAGSGIVRSDTKSLFAAPSAETPTPPYTAATCRRRDQGSAVKYLGVMIGDEDEQFQRKVEEMGELHEKIRSIDDPALELLLTRECADAGKVMHLLRAVGPSAGDRVGLTAGGLEQMDTVMGLAVGGVMRAEPTVEAGQQAGWGVRYGGLGLRPGTLIALPARVASLVEARPMVEWMAGMAASRGIQAVRSVGEVADEAADLLLEGPHSAALKARIEKSVEAADEIGARRAAEMLGLEVEWGERERGGREGDRRVADPLADREAEEAGDMTKARLQERLVGAIEREQVDLVMDGLKGSKSEADVMRRRRLADLGNAESKHGWLTAVNPAHGPVLRADQFITCLRMRLGMAPESYDGAAKCSACDREVTAEWMGIHALCCAKGQSVKGHNRVRDHLADLAKISDATTSTEQKVGSAAGAAAENWRPADILTSASPFGGVGSAALDVGITCPLAASAQEGQDAVDMYRTKKIRKYKVIAERAHWQYHPVIMSCFGRPHVESVRLVRRLAQAAGRKFGVEDVARIEERWWKHCSTLLAERVADMVLRCSPTIGLPPALGGEVDADERGGGDVEYGRTTVVDVSAVVVGADGGGLP